MTESAQFARIEKAMAANTAAVAELTGRFSGLESRLDERCTARAEQLQRLSSSVSRAHERIDAMEKESRGDERALALRVQGAEHASAGLAAGLGELKNMVQSLSDTVDGLKGDRQFVLGSWRAATVFGAACLALGGVVARFFL